MALWSRAWSYINWVTRHSVLSSTYEMEHAILIISFVPVNRFKMNTSTFISFVSPTCSNVINHMLSSKSWPAQVYRNLGVQIEWKVSYIVKLYIRLTLLRFIISWHGTQLRLLRKYDTIALVTRSMYFQKYTVFVSCYNWSLTLRLWYTQYHG